MEEYSDIFVDSSYRLVRTRLTWEEARVRYVKRPPDNLFVCVSVLHPSQQKFSHVGGGAVYCLLG